MQPCAQMPQNKQCWSESLVILTDRGPAASLSLIRLLAAQSDKACCHILSLFSHMTALKMCCFQRAQEVLTGIQQGETVPKS